MKCNRLFAKYQQMAIHLWSYVDIYLRMPWILPLRCMWNVSHGTEMKPIVFTLAWKFISTANALLANVSTPIINVSSAPCLTGRVQMNHPSQIDFGKMVKFMGARIIIINHVNGGRHCIVNVGCTTKEALIVKFNLWQLRDNSFGRSDSHTQKQLSQGIIQLTCKFRVIFFFFLFEWFVLFISFFRFFFLCSFWQQSGGYSGWIGGWTLLTFISRFSNVFFFQLVHNRFKFSWTRLTRQTARRSLLLQDLQDE